ncbi:MAG: Bug family tripartite tricarboxylate transporter substrate binding protein [Hyphomicrobiaceae bacterium]
MHRRNFLKLVTGSAAAGLAAPALAQGVSSWPDKPVRVIVPYAPGGGTDIIARPWVDKLSQAFGQPFVIENRGGASGMIGTEAAAKAPADGYTLLFTPNNTLNILPLLQKVPYDPLKSFEPIGRAGDMVCGFVVHPAVGIKTFKDLIEHAKKNPGKLAYASSGNGTATQLRVEMLKLKAGIDILHVPYRGGADALNDVLANNAQMMNESSSLPHVKAGKLILLNVNHPVRSSQYPDIPTLTELGLAGADVPIWFSLWGPAGTPKEIREKINAKMAEIGKTDDMKARVEGAGYATVIQSIDEVRQALIDGSKDNEGLIKAADIKLQ